MSARVSIILFGSMLALAGCLSDEKKLATVSSSPFGKTQRPQTASFKQAPPATKEISLRVDRVGQKIVEANSRLKQQKVAFLTLGYPGLEIFHQVQKDGCAVCITEGLVNKCKNDGELAALLSQELAKIVSEQLAQAKPLRDTWDRPPMLTPRIGNDIGGTFGPADGTDQMILYRDAKDRQQNRTTLAAPPPPETLARLYLQGAGYDPKSLDAVTNLLRQADKDNTLEQSMSGKNGG